MNSIVSVLAAAGTVAATLLLTGCDSGHAASGIPNVGRPCSIQFRRDVLGASATLPISPMTGSINGAETSITGNLKRTEAEWIILDKGGSEVWVPKSVILLIQYH